MIQQIKNLISESKQFKVVPGNGNAREIILNDDGSVADPNGEITNWDVTTDIRMPANSIVLKRGGGHFGVFSWDYADYRGRDHTGLRAALVPEAASRFKNLYTTNGVALENFSLRGIGNNAVAPQPGERVDHSDPDIWSNIEVLDPALKTKESALILIGYNRPEYFKQVVDALAENKNIGDYDIYVFLDKPKIFAEEITQEQQKDYAEDHLDVAYTVVRPINFGCGWNISDAKNQVFDLGYEKVFVFEDDMVPDTTYLTFCENLLAWGQKNYDNVGAVQGWTKCVLDKTSKKPLAKEVHVTYTNLWGYLQTKESWDAMKDEMNEYLNVFLTSTYERRPARAILQWMGEKMMDAIEHENSVPIDGNSLLHFQNYFSTPPSGQDGVTGALLHTKGYVRLAPTVNRGLYIGRHGIHMDDRQYERDRFHQVQLDNMSDSRRKNFELRQDG